MHVYSEIMLGYTSLKHIRGKAEVVKIMHEAVNLLSCYIASEPVFDAQDQPQYDFLVMPSSLPSLQQYELSCKWWPEA